MRTIIHDLQQEPNGINNVSDHIVAARDAGTTCKGCFGCWVKTPGKCVIPDGCMNMGHVLAMTDQLVLISRCVYGSVSSDVKKVMDRSISYAHPCFVVNNHEMHHKRRYDTHFSLRILFYGEMTEQEKETAKRFANMLKVKYGATRLDVKFYQKEEEIAL